MKELSDKRRRIQEIRSVLEGQGLEDLEFLEGWDGEDLEDLASDLSEEEFQALIDELEKQE